MKVLLFALLLFPICNASRVGQMERTSLSVNPIRRVVTMLQQMQKKVTAEGKLEEELFEKFMCYCKNGAGELQQAIDDAETKIPQLQSSIKELEAEIGQLVADLKKHKKDRADAESALANGKALREKENAAFVKESGDLKTNIAALTKAIGALEKGAAGGFLQTSSASVLRQLTIKMELSNTDRDVLASFLAEGANYSPKSGEITGILKQMSDTMQSELKSAVAEEEKAAADFEGMAKAKAKEIEALTASIESKTERMGNGGVELVNMKEDLDDTQKSLAEDKKFLADLAKNCASKEKEWAERQKVRAEELLALADTIKILNDDDALELFKKTLPTPSLLLVQVSVSNKELRAKALAVLGRRHDSRIDLISLALKGRKVDFGKVLKMIDEMVSLLGQEQKDDDEKKAFCEAALDKAEDEAKVLKQNIDDTSKLIDELSASIETLGQEIAALIKGIKDLDKQVADQTEQRKEEHNEFVETLAANNAAKELIGFAKNRMNKFYNPKLYKAPPKRELSEEERITVNMGGTLAATAAPGGIAGTGIGLVQDAPAPPPETWGAYKKKGEESSGVIAMMDMLVADLDKEIQTMEVDEKNAQEEYEQFMQDAADKRAADSKSIQEKEAAKADAESDLQKATEDKKGLLTEAMKKGEEIAALHSQCDWLLTNFDARKEARAGEIDSLKKAKAVLSGADFS